MELLTSHMAPIRLQRNYPRPHANKLRNMFRNLHLLFLPNTL